MKKLMLCFLMLASLFSITSCKKDDKGNDGIGTNDSGSNEDTSGSESTGGGESTDGNENTNGKDNGGGYENTGTGSTGGEINTSNPSWDNVNSSNTINVIEAQGHLESAYIKWTGVTDAVSYNVYYKEQSANEFTKLDDMLVRLYPTYLRADAVGLKAGSYTLKIAPVFASGEGSDVATANVTVSAHDRSGFAFSQASALKDASGAYNSDGTLKSGAQVVYVTKDTAKTVTATVNGNVQTGFQTILDAKQKKNTSNDIICFRIIGTVSKSDLDHISSSLEGLQIKGASANTNMNITIEGIGDDATFNGYGMLIRNCANVEIRNIGIINFMDDGISVDTANSNLWLHNNDFFYGNAGGDADQAKGDGSLDIKKSTYITVSYNHFWDAGKCCLLDAGVDSSGSNYITYHHNWFDHSDSRHPRVRNASAVHVYNNYYDGVAKYGIGAAGGGSSIFSEANYFRNTKYPLLISKQGSDIATDDKGTFSNEDGGIIKSFADVMIGGTFVPYSSSNSVEFDAYVATSRGEQLANTIVSKKGGHSYSNFDTDESMYSYYVQSAEDAKETVEKYAGRINGGDLKYDFVDSQEDSNSEIVSELKTMVVNYKTSLVKVLGVTASTGGTTGSDSTNSGNTGDDLENTGSSSSNGATVIEGAITHNFTESDKTSDVFNITGNTSTSKGTVSYNGLSLTKCLKLESSTNISFTTTVDMTLTLVLNSVNGTNIKVDGDKKEDSSGIITVELAAGSHTITKADTANLFYIVLTPKN